MTDRKAEFDDFIAAWPPRVQEIALAAREFVLEVLPQPLEMIDTSSKLVGYGFGQRYVDMVCSLIPSQNGVKLGLAYGASLPDPKDLLAGEGKVHRHIRFQSLADIRRPGVRPLLRAALAAQRARAKPAKN